MKKLLIATVTLLLLALAVTAFADRNQPTFKTGDIVYVCGCGEGCGCFTMSRKAGKCSCGKDLIKGSVTRIDKEKIYVTANGKETAFPAVAKYACACGEGCNCGTVSQKQGKCACGKEMKAVK